MYKVSLHNTDIKLSQFKDSLITYTLDDGLDEGLIRYDRLEVQHWQYVTTRFGGIVKEIFHLRLTNVEDLKKPDIRDDFYEIKPLIWKKKKCLGEHGLKDQSVCWEQMATYRLCCNFSAKGLCVHRYANAMPALNSKGHLHSRPIHLMLSGNGIHLSTISEQSLTCKDLMKNNKKSLLYHHHYLL